MMPLVEKNPPPTDSAPADPFAWDPDPLVLVSRRARILYFPKVLATRDATDADYQRWHADTATIASRQEEQLAVGAGVTFLGTWTTSWNDLHTTRGHATSIPDPSKMLLVEPFSRVRDAITRRENKDPATGRLLPHRVAAIYARIVRHLQREAADERAGVLNPWEVQDGFDGPELALVRLSEMFTQRTEAGQQAHATVTSTIRHLRRDRHEVLTPLGALHDYAVRGKGGGASAILEECRRWAAVKKIG